jgi:hypothetical protein
MLYLRRHPRAQHRIFLGPRLQQALASAGRALQTEGILQMTYQMALLYGWVFFAMLGGLVGFVLGSMWTQHSRDDR